MRMREDCVNGIVITERGDAVVMQQTDTKGKSGSGYLGDGDVKSEEAKGDSQGL
jgi:hypothetical protein